MYIGKNALVGAALVLVAALLGGIYFQLPEIRRYLKIESM